MIASMPRSVLGGFWAALLAVVYAIGEASGGW